MGLTVGLTSGLTLGACYTASFDPDASAVFVCASDDDCPTGQPCFDGLCVSDEGPSVAIFGPEPFQRVASDNADALANFTITVRGGDLTLTDGNQAVDGEGFLRVEIDGEDLYGRIVSGELSSGFTTDAVDLSAFSIGPHRIRVTAMQGDAKPYPNPSASAESMFFIDDGSPQVAVVAPRPGHVQSASEPMAVTVAAINWTWKSPNSTLADGEGHTHVYALDDYPACLDVAPTSDDYCNFKYLVSISGEGRSDNALLIDGEVPVETLELLPLGSQPFQAGLQNNEHGPFPSDAAVEFDQIEFELVGN